MKIRTQMGVSLDGFVATPDGRPAHLKMPDFDPGVSHGFPELIAQSEAVLMGRTTFLPALDHHRWPWPGKQVFVPRVAGAPDHPRRGAAPSHLPERRRSRCGSSAR